MNARLASAVLCSLALLAAGRGLVRHNTWYLASDQFAFLTFADDLVDGHVLHDPATIALLAGDLPPNAAADAYYQTYVWRGGRLYSRYPPGYPLLLAAANLVGGERAEHWLNPLLYLGLVGLVAGLACRLAVGGTGAGAAAAAAWALLVVPAEVHYWGITVVRDLPAHLLALGSLLAALAGRVGAAGLALGLATSIRPDAALWAVSVGPVLALARPGRRGVAVGTLAFLVGALPLFAYNTFTQGHPLAFTQGNEFRGVFTSAAAALPDVDLRSGGAFRLAHFPSTVRAHVHYLAGAFGGFAVLALATMAVAAARGHALARALVPYAVVGLAFYSCWGHGDARYLVGVSIALLVATACGAAALADRLADAERRRLGLLLVVVAVAVVGQRLVFPDPDRGRVPVEWAVAIAFGLAAGLPSGRRLASLLPAVAFAAIGLWRVATSTSERDAFQEAQITRARAALEAVLPARALVLTSPGLGRPAENITHYTHADAHYVAELPGLRSNQSLVALRCARMKRPLFFLLDAREPPPAGWFVQPIARRTGDALRDWFVDPRQAPDGAVLWAVGDWSIPPAR